MTTFDRIIGYETIKNELMQICDMIHNKEIYTAIGAKMLQGLLLYGEPGLGKTLMAKCFLEESGLPAYTIRRNKGTDDFVEEITSTFRKAKENAPAIIFLDDMDKFANEDEYKRDAEEYVAIQSGIDEVKGGEVFVLATANNIRKLPSSLIRSGRFDRKNEVCNPSPDDAYEIIKHYMKDKKIAEDLNLEDAAMMIKYSSCAELETILNEAAIQAAYARRESISIQDMIHAVLRMEYDAPDNFVKPSEEGSINICARLSIEKYGNGFTATDLKNCIAYNNKTEWAYNLEQFGFYKPNRISHGKTMTVGKVWKEERSDIGYEELTDTLQKTVFAFEDFIHYCHAINDLFRCGVIIR